MNLKCLDTNAKNNNKIIKKKKSSVPWGCSHSSEMRFQTLRGEKMKRGNPPVQEVGVGQGAVW